MATNTRFVKVDGAFQRPENLTQGQNFTDPAGRTGAVMYDPNTGRRLQLGETVNNISSAKTSNTAGSGLPSTTANPAASSPAPSQNGSAMDSFNLLMTDMLKSAQGVNTADLLKRKRELERASLGNSSEITPENLRTLSPDQQRAIRSGKTEALRPEIDDNAYELEKAQQSIDNFFRVHGEAMKIGSEFAEKMVAPDSVINNAKRIIEANPDSLSTVLAGFNDKTKEKLLGSLDYGKMKKPVASTNTSSSATTTTTGPSAYSTERANRTVQSVDELLGQVNGWTTGFGSLLSFIPLTDAKYFKAQISTLKSNIITNELTAMREASKTGGALGAISDKESAFMSDALGALDTAVTPEQFKKQLDKIKASVQRWQLAASGHAQIPGAPTQSGGTVRMSGPKGTFNVPADQVNTFTTNGYTKI